MASSTSIASSRMRGALPTSTCYACRRCRLAIPSWQAAKGADQFAALATRLPGYSAIAGTATDAPHRAGRRRAFGNMILSRLPVGAVYRHLLPWPVDPAVFSMQLRQLLPTAC